MDCATSLLRSESSIQAEILTTFGARPGWLIWRQMVGSAPAWDGKAVLRFGTPGQADILGVVRGRAIAIEVKSQRGKQRDAQKLWQRAFEAAGGLYVVARSVEDVETAVATL